MANDEISRCVFSRSTAASTIPSFVLVNVTCVAQRLYAMVDAEAPPLFCLFCGRPCVDKAEEAGIGQLVWWPE